MTSPISPAARSTTSAKRRCSASSRRSARVLTYSAREALDDDYTLAPIVDLLPDERADVHQQVEDRATLRDFHRRLDTELSPLEATAVVAFAVGLNYHEVAAGERGKKSVDNALQRARLKLRPAA